MAIIHHRLTSLTRRTICVVMALGSLIVVLGDQRSALPPRLDGPPQPVPAAYFGMHVHRLLESTPWPSVPFGAIRLWDTGTTWKDLEPRKNDWRFDRLDRLVNMAADHHVPVLLCFGKTPAWASSIHSDHENDERVETAPPANLEDWRHFIERIASHYKGSIEAYEVWNEANWHGYYSGDVHTMVEMTRIAAETIHTIDPSALVVSPSATTFDGLPWFESFLEQGGGSYVDVIAYHLYVYPDAPETIPVLAREVRSSMTRNHVSMPLWDTETGWSKPKVFNSDDEASAYVARSLMLAWASGVSRFYWYAWDNRNWVTLNLTSGDTYQPKAAAQAFQIVENWMEDHQVRDCLRSKDGTWTCHLLQSGVESMALWNPVGKVRYPLPAAGGTKENWTVSDLHGDTRRVRPGEVYADQQPLLLQRQN